MGYRKNLGIILIMTSLLLLGGCGWSMLMTSEERAAVAFKSGTEAYETAEFSQATVFFRQVPPESALYNQSVQMILRANIYIDCKASQTPNPTGKFQKSTFSEKSKKSQNPGSAAIGGAL